jgi:hypothetical protein
MEKAGLALRVFPLLIKRLQIWSDTTDRIKDIKHYKRVLQRLVRQLNMEKCKFENICGLLVEGIASTEDEATLLQGHGWQDPKFQVKERLRPAQAMAFDDALETLTCCLQELGHAVGLVEDREVCILTFRSFRTVNFRNQPLEETVSKTQWKKIRLMLREESHTSLLDKINKINFDLFHLTMQRPSSTGIRSATRQPPAARNYNRIRSHAKSLYSILQEKFQTTMCTCRLPHNAGLKLEKATVDGADQADIRLEVFFDFETVQGISHVEKEWRALEFEPVERDSIIQKSHASDDMKSGVQRSDMGNPGPTSEETEGPAPVRELTLIGNRTARFAVLRSIGKRHVLKYRAVLSNSD